MPKKILLTLASLGLAFTCAAVETRFWQQYDPADYEKATLSKLSLRSDGRISLAPTFKEIFDASTSYLWAVAEDSKGNVYAAGGAPTASSAKLFQIDPSGKGKVLAELNGLEIHAIAVDKQDRVYAATSPDGRIFRVSANGTSQVFYDPKTKYIWAIAFNSKGDLFVATGDKGEIHRVTPDGKGQVFFQSDEAHARSLAIDGKDNVIVGTEPGGLVIRVAPSGEGFVLYQFAKREVTAVAAAKDGSIYAAAVGTKAASILPAPPQVPIVAPPGPQPAAATTARTAPAPAPPTLAPTPAISGGSEVYRIDADGSPRRVWQNPTDLVYGIAFDAKGLPLIATGNRGRIYRIDSDRLSTTLVMSTSTQITAMQSSRKGAVYAVTANIGKVYQLGPDVEKDGTVESDALDAGAFSQWGRLRWEGEEQGGALVVETRSGNLDRPHKNWSNWSAVTMNSKFGRMNSPAARFLQYRLKLTASGNGASPAVTMVELAYLTKNVPPTVEEIEPTPANYKFPASTVSITTSASPATLSLPPIGQRRRGGGLSLDGSSNSMNYAKGWIGARWRSADENGDPLSFKVEIRGVGEREWKLLKDNVKEKQFSWDSTAFPDGEYQLRVIASDAPGNPPAQALTAEQESDPFLIDNTAPLISGLSGALEQGKIAVRWKAKDARSVIEKAEYSVNGGEWLNAQPVSRLSDSLDLDYALTLERQGNGEQTIAVRVVDEFENQAVEKVTVR